MAEDKKEDVQYQIVNLGMDTYEPPKMKVIKKGGTQYVGYGDDNAYPQYLDSLMGNAEHNAIVRSKVDYIAGEGFNLDLLEDQQKKFFKDNDMDNLAAKLTMDYEKYGGFCFYVIKNKAMDGIAKLEYADFAKMRLAAEEDHYLIGENWEKYRTETKQIFPYEEETDRAKTLYYYKGSTTKDAYPIPHYYGAIPAIETGIEIDNFHLNHVRNGFFIPTVFNFNNGIPDEDKQDEIERDIKSKFTGSDKAGGFLLTFNDDKDSAVSIETFEPADLDKKFEVLAEQIQQKVFAGHRVTSPMLFGLKTEGQLGGRNELIEAYELFKNTYISPTQNVIQGAIMDVLDENWDELNVELEQTKPIDSLVPDDQLYQVMTEEEIRKDAGLPERELSESEQDLMKLSQMPKEVLQAVIGKMNDKQLSDIIGIDLTKSQNNEEETP